MKTEIFIDTSPLASLSSRFVALILDGLVIFAVCFTVGLLTAWIFPLFWLVPGVLLSLLYHPIFEASVLQATPGKRVMGIRVTDLSGGRITLRASLVRWVIRNFLLFLSCLFAFFTSKKQALHDLVADTLVMEGDVDSSLSLVDAWVAEMKTVFSGAEETFSTLSTSSQSAKSEDKLGELARLNALRKDGALSDEEFQRLKAKLLAD